MHGNRFPNETPEYRRARDELLDAERDLRRRIEAVAELRRRLPLGGEVKEDYAFETASPDVAPSAVPLSGLFASGQSTLLLYSFMYGPAMKQACPMCTSFLDGLEGNALHVRQRVSLAVVAKSPPERIREYARSRGWSRMPLFSSAGTTFNRDYFAEDGDGGQHSVLHTFVKRDGRVHHFTSTELAFERAAPGQNNRHIDLLWPLWNALDLTPEGRGSDWYPKLSY
jgi:predicted dithiol-disulfide oxidoreductase (DUF899 family)